MRKTTLASILAGVRIAVAVVVIAATSYSAAVFIWMKNGTVVTYDGYEVKTTSWNLIPYYFSTGEASYALSISLGLVAVVMILLLVLYILSKKSLRALRARSGKPQEAIRNSER